MEQAGARGCRSLVAHKIGHALGVRIHAMTLKLPWFEMGEEGRQIRRSSRSVTARLIEGYRLRKYRYLPADETREHLDCLRETSSLEDPDEHARLASENDRLLAKLAPFIIGVERSRTRPLYLQEPGVAGPHRQSPGRPRTEVSSLTPIDASSSFAPHG